jgi:hypothetical protein
MPRKKPLKGGRTNPPPVVGPAGALNADFLRRVRPRAKAVVFPPPLPDVVVSPGGRVERDELLTVEDLWQSPGGGPPHMPDADERDCCSVCLQLLSHPVL